MTIKSWSPVKPETTIHDDVFIFGEPDFIESDPYEIYSCPIDIHIDAYGCYWEEIPEEVESEDEEDDPATIKSYRETHCVVCLMNEPKVLFYMIACIIVFA